MKKKLVAVLLSVAMVATMLVGCSDPAQETTSNSSSNDSASTEVVADEVASTEEAPDETEEVKSSEEGVMTLETVAAAAQAVEIPDFTGYEASDLKVALLVPDSITEPGWSKTGADAMEDVKEMGCTTTIIEANSTDVMKSEAEALADEGYQIIIGHGNQYEDAFAEICENYPDTVFVTIGGTTFRKNQFPYYSAINEPYYLAGMMAGLLTESNKVGFVVGANWASFMKSAYSYRDGAKAVNPDVEFTVTVLNDSSDMNEGYEAGQALISSGYDVIGISANSAGNGVVQACQDNGVYACDHGGDFSETAPDATYVNIYDTFEPCFASFINKLLDGTFEVDPTGNTSFGFDDGYWSMEYPENANLPEDVLSILDEYQDKVISGEIDTVTELDIALGNYDAE